MRVRWTALAVSDLQEIRQYIGVRNRVAARGVARKIRATVAVLFAQPGIGRPGRIAGTRELVVDGTPFVIPYRVRDETLEILRVLHGARRWPRRL